ncbi:MULTISPECIES: MAPEG family protein [unclassified Sphingomonas]|jgi:hypothetical protein|uniref:MAPEG family protein n=2 Tax=Sphingomonas TaxID=13687 RepID=UPI00082B8EB9|nr:MULTISPECIES: MAPEG family protein [unclassified Sphingomonas]
MTSHSPILAPVVALAAWTLVMWGWMYVRRIPAMRRAGIDATTLVGGTGADLRQRLDARAGWPADNYNHLLEQPTIFYAVAIVLALTGWGGGFNLALAWAYVALRIAHSLVQVTTNRVIVRFALFALATLALVALTLHAAIAVF